MPLATAFVSTWSRQSRWITRSQTSTRAASTFRHRISKSLVPTSKEKFVHVAGQEMVPSQQFLLRAGMMRQSSSGIYTIMPFGQRVLDKIETIIDQELEQIDCQKLSLPHLLQSDNWKKSGRWQTAGQEMFKLNDRRGGEYCLAPTHEEEVTALIAKEVQSYRQLPIRVYQVGRKFRDELRARSGLLRGKEFVMKDLYTFDVSEEEALNTYNQVVETYRRILNRIDVPFAVADADTGNIGGTHSHEFHILSRVGEDSLLFCRSCGYTSNEERAVGILPETPTKIATKFRNDQGSVAKWIENLQLIPREPVRLNPKVQFGILSQPDDKTTLVAVAVAGDRTANEVKVGKAIGNLELVDTLEEVQTQLKETKVDELMLCVDKTLFHHSQSPLADKTVALENVPLVVSQLLTPDLQRPEIKVHYGDYHNCLPGDGCPQCGGENNTDKAIRPMELTRAIEIGHTFLLGTKYSNSLNATFVPVSGQAPEPMQMGCYGLGITRLMASIVEASHDKKGMVWPEAVAPFRVVVVTSEDEACVQAGEKAYDIVQASLKTRADVILDDRVDETLGFKMKDAELIGYPWMVVIGKGFLRHGKVEIQHRKTGEREVADWDALAAFFGQRQL